MSIQLYVTAFLGALIFTYPTNALAQEFLVAVPPSNLRSAEVFLDRVNGHEAMEAVNIRLVAVADDEIGALPNTSAYLVEFGYSFVLTAQISDLLAEEHGDTFAYTALLAESTAFASFEQQRAVEASVIGDIAEIELGAIDLIAVSDWPTTPSVLLSRGLYTEASDLQGQRVIANAPDVFAAMEEFGASPVRVPVSEIFQAVEAGFADAFVTSPEIAAATLADWQGGSLVTGLQLPQGYLLAEVEAWLALDERGRQALRTAAEDVARTERERQIEAERASIAISAEFSNSVVSFSKFAAERADGNRLRQKWDERYGSQGTSAVDLLREVLEELETPPAQPVEETPAPTPEVDPIAFITNRTDDGGSDPRTRFGARRDARAGLTCGLLNPVDPRVRSFGQPYGGTILSNVDSEARGADDCVELIKLWLGANDELLVFFHGFNNTFDDAVRRAVAYKLDVGMDLRILVWSWPSMGDGGGYVHDMQSVNFSRRDVEPFAKALLNAGLGPKTTLLAHSMGSMVAIDLVGLINRSGGTLDSLFLVAPDVPLTLFEAFTLDHRTAVPGLVVYANGADRALAASMAVNRERPIGLGGPNRNLIDNVETVDVTNLAKSKIRWRTNHSHAFDIPAVAQDMATAISGGASAVDRGLVEIIDKGGKFYQIGN